MKIRALGWFSILLGCLACQESGAVEDPVVGATTLASCRKAWNGITSMQAMSGLAPRELGWHDGSLYFRQDEALEPRFATLPESGGEPSEISSEAGWGLWIEGDALLYRSFDRLYSVPLSGGAPTLVSDGGTFGEDEARRENTALVRQDLDDSYLYWVLHRYHDPMWSVWRAPRAGGRSEQIGILPDALGYPEALVALPEQLLIAGGSGEAYVLPKDGGDARELPVVVDEREGSMWSRFLAAAQSGVAWAVAKQAGGPSHFPYDIVLITPSGEMKDLWRSMPAQFIPDHAWADDAGVWIIAGTEPFTDGERHTSIWSLDAHDRATRLACDPRAGFASGFATAAAFGDDSVFLVVQYSESSKRSSDEGDSTGWKLVQVER